MMSEKEKLDLATIMKREFDRVHKKMDRRFDKVDERLDALDKKIDFKINELRDEMKHEFMSVRRGIDYLSDRIENHEKRIRVLEGDESCETL